MTVQDKRLTKKDGLTFDEWRQQLDKAAQGYKVYDPARHLYIYFNSDWTAEDAWQEIFEEQEARVNPALNLSRFGERGRKGEKDTDNESKDSSDVNRVMGI